MVQFALIIDQIFYLVAFSFCQINSNMFLSEEADWILFVELHLKVKIVGRFKIIHFIDVLYSKYYFRRQCDDGL